MLKEMTYAELCKLFRKHEEKNPEEHLTARIIITKDSFTKEYTEEQRTYEFSSRNKAFEPNMGGYSIFGSCIDGTDQHVRLEQYLADECFDKDGWKIEKCFLVEAENIK